MEEAKELRRLDALNLIPSSNIDALYTSQKKEDPLKLRRKAADFRKGYKNWRQKKPKGAKGETNDMLDIQKSLARDIVDAEHHKLEEAAVELTEDLDFTTTISSITSYTGPLSHTNLLRTASVHGISKQLSFYGGGAMEIEHEDDKENWLKFYVNPYSGMAEADVVEPIDLSMETLKQLPSNVIVPMYDRDGKENQPDLYICHIGVGGFFRSHQCEYMDDLLNRDTTLQSHADPREKWGYCGIGLMEWDRNMYDALRCQDYLFAVLTRGNCFHSARVIGSMFDYIYAPDNHQICINRLAHPSTRIVSLTITEKGYCEDINGDLDMDDPLIKADLKSNLIEPSSAIGMIVAGLKARWERRIPPYTVLSCDNLPDNGDKTRHVVLQLAEVVDKRLKNWIEEWMDFPNTMVDRITPATEQDHKSILAKDHRILDRWPVIAEDFRQWVIEDKFCNGRPNWDEVGALLVNDVKPYEYMKLRLLNGGHSALSYIGILSGYQYVDDAMNDESVELYMNFYFLEMKNLLLPLPGLSIDEYCSTIISRFKNPYIKDRLTRLAEDGSQKMRSTMRDAIIDLLKRGNCPKMMAFANAAWIRVSIGTDEMGEFISFKDPMKQQLKKLAFNILEDGSEDCDPTQFLQEIHGCEVVKCGSFVKAVSGYLKDIKTLGFRHALQDLLKSVSGGLPSTDGGYRHILEW